MGRGRFCNALSRRDGLTPAYQPAGDEDAEWAESADGYRLPTEAEWEHACRAGRTGARYGPLDEIAWHRRNSDGRIHDVGGKQPNAWGLYDMRGRSHPTFRIDDVGFRVARNQRNA